jgi:hypothetical protein
MPFCTHAFRHASTMLHPYHDEAHMAIYACSCLLLQGSWLRCS